MELHHIDLFTFLTTAFLMVSSPCFSDELAFPRRSQRFVTGFASDAAKYRNGLSSMFSFQHSARELSAGPRHVRQQPGKMDGFGGTASGAIGSPNSDAGSIYWMSPDPNSPDLQAWTGASGGSAVGAGAPVPQQQPTGGAASVPSQAVGGGASSPMMNAAAVAYGIQQQQLQQAQQSLSAPQMPSQQAQASAQQQQQQPIGMALAQPQQQQVQQQQQQQPMSMMPYQPQGGGAGVYGYGGQQGGYGMGGGYGSSSAGGGQMPVSPYSSYLEKQISTYPIMIYTLNECIPCQRAKHLLAVHYPDVRAHYLELSGNEAWQQQLQIDLQYLTGAITFPYIFVCGQYIGGATELFELHESGQLRRMVAQCLKTAPPK
ncbi:hypothetical protein niasHT_013731 [Heterodera trifolii]|uniref:Glutaredoxin domain-containing protein n=1 Tax=Heterodera trifolii TaxID=157864 RepID=A0ABD2LBV4_9BILA